MEKETIAYRFLLALFADVDTMPADAVRRRVMAARELWAKYIDNEQGNLHTDQQPTAQQPRPSIPQRQMVDAQ
jgi:hypothetical protein